MSNATIYLLAASGIALIAFGCVALALIHLARDYAEDRGRESEYADEWRRIHEQNRKRQP